MAKKKPWTARVLGLDVAAVNTGLCVIEAVPISEQPLIEYEVLHAAPVIAKGDFRARMHAAEYIKGVASVWKPDLVVLEDYARSSKKSNTSAYEHAELGGMVRALLHASRIPLLTVPPTTMRSYLDVPRGLPDSGKQFIIDYAHEVHGFLSDEGNQTNRSNVTDAFIHSTIGALVIFAKLGKIEGSLTPEQERLLYGNGKKVIGLLNRHEDYFNCEWMEQTTGDGKKKN